MKDCIRDKYKISEIIEKTNKGLLNIHHALQRASGQWTPSDKSSLISDILQKNPIPELVLAEEDGYGDSCIWVLDGVQRISTVNSYIEDKFKISKKVERYMMEYVVPVLDEDGVHIKDESGRNINEIKYFDIRGKKFSQLPKELQKKILGYCFDAVIYKDCSEENIAYHLKRYNAGKPMNAEQKGLTYVGALFANAIRNISTMSFFEDAIGKYTANDFKSGKINRVIAESLMTTRFLDEWSKDYNANCKHIKEKASSEDFEYLSSLIERLEDNIDETVGKMFTIKDSFLWIGLYSRFVKTGLSDYQFNRFMLELKHGMITYDPNGKEVARENMIGVCAVEIDGCTWEHLLKNKSTKDVNIVKERINFLVKLMCKFLNVAVPEEDYSDELNGELKEFAKEFDSEETAIETFMLTTESHPFNDFKTSTIKKMIKWYKQNGSKAMLSDCLSYKSYVDDVEMDTSDKNLPLYIYAAKCAYDADIDFVEWFNEFKETGFQEIDADDKNVFEENYTIRLKQDLIKTYINKFKNKGEAVDEYDV